MVSIVSCKYCNSENIELDSIYINLQFCKNTYCKDCRKSHVNTEDWFFCSIKCLEKYIKSAGNLSKEVKLV